MNAEQMMILFSAGLALVTAISLLTVKRSYQQILIASGLFLTAYMHFLMYLNCVPIDESRMIFFNSHFFVLFALGPLLLLITQTIIRKKDGFSPADLLHFIPALLAELFVLTRYHYLPTEQKLLQVQNLNIRILPADLKVVSTLAILSLIINTALVLYHLYRYIQNSRSIPRSVYFLLFMNLMTLSGFIAYMLPRSVLADYPIKGVYISIFSSFNTVNIFFFLQYYVMRSPSKNGKEEKKTGKIFDLDLAEINTRLRRIIDIEKVFCDEDLSLAKLAAHLKLTTHQLSYFLNTHYSKNFNTFINEFRVEEAKKMLVEEPERNTLSVGFAVGFNSSSSFHSVFKKHTGLSPADYRRNFSAKKICQEQGKAAGR